MSKAQSNPSNSRLRERLRAYAANFYGIDDRDRASAGLLQALYARIEADRAIIENLEASVQVLQAVGKARLNPGQKRKPNV